MHIVYRAILASIMHVLGSLLSPAIMFYAAYYTCNRRSWVWEVTLKNSLFSLPFETLRRLIGLQLHALSTVLKGSRWQVILWLKALRIVAT